MRRRAKGRANRALPPEDCRQRTASTDDFNGLCVDIKGCRWRTFSIEMSTEKRRAMVPLPLPHAQGPPSVRADVPGAARIRRDGSAWEPRYAGWRRDTLRLNHGRYL
uniref:Uncharacterized protein n=1 Tax=Knipowitschia caucasica TaxID=637954 RepID=A0AAV2JYW6_KNICA